MAVQDGGMFQDLLARLAGTAGAVGPAVERVMQRPGMYGGIATAGLMGAQNLLEGDLLGAAGSTLGGLGAAKLASKLPLPAPLKLASVVGAGLLGGGVGEQLAGGIPAIGEQVKGYLGVPGAEEVAGREKEKRARATEREQARLDYEAMSRAQLARDKEYLSYMLPQMVEAEKAMIPLREQMLRSQRVNQQALNASNAALYQQMGRSATMGKFLLGQQAEAGATTRTLLSQNPYAGSVLQAPSISF